MTPRSDDGAIAPMAVAVIGLLLFVTAALGVVSSLIADHRRAQAAADLAALAGAGAVQQGGDGCKAAGRIAEANDARIDGCKLDGPDVHVTVTVVGPRWLGQTGDLSAEARAGPPL